MVIQLECGKGATTFEFVGEIIENEYVSSVPCVVQNTVWQQSTICTRGTTIQAKAIHVLLFKILQYMQKILQYTVYCYTNNVILLRPNVHFDI